MSGAIVDATLDELSDGDVVIAAEYSSVNYKDALAATGAAKILKRFPLIGGIDVAGTVVSSTDARFHDGDRVLVTGYDLGVANDGGYSEYVRVPADWVVPLPTGLSLLDAMALGTAGFTAAMSVIRLEQNGLTPGAGPVVVTGATGGVGSIAVADPRAPRLRGDRRHRQGRRARLPEVARRDDRAAAIGSREERASARQGDMGRSRRSRRRRHARLADQDDELRREASPTPA